LYKAERPDDAQAAFALVIDIGHDQPNIRFQRGNVYASLGKHDAALADFSESINLDPKDAKTWSNRGAVYKKLGQLDKAIADFSTAIELDPKFVAAWSNRGIACMGLGEWAKAAADYARIVELEPQNAGARHKLARCSVQLGRYQEALDGYRQLVEDLPKAALPRNELPVHSPGAAAQLAERARAEKVCLVAESRVVAQRSAQVEAQGVRRVLAHDDVVQMAGAVAAQAGDLGVEHVPQIAAIEALGHGCGGEADAAQESSAHATDDSHAPMLTGSGCGR
jgi:tetratricopeptide (TPR) repeat protein